MCSASSRAKRTSLPKETSRTKCASRSAQAEHIVPKQKALLTKCFLFWRRHPDLNWGIKVLQTSALPLGYGAIQLSAMPTILSYSQKGILVTSIISSTLELYHIFSLLSSVFFTFLKKISSEIFLLRKIVFLLEKAKIL